jgi:hypothetical protein
VYWAEAEGDMSDERVKVAYADEEAEDVARTDAESWGELLVLAEYRLLVVGVAVTQPEVEMVRVAELACDTVCVPVEKGEELEERENQLAVDETLPRLEGLLLPVAEEMADVLGVAGELPETELTAEEVAQEDWSAVALELIES